MNYPELDLEAALNGALVIVFIEPNCEEIGFIHRSKSNECFFIFENKNRRSLFLIMADDLFNKVRMYVKPAVFKNWHLIADRFTTLTKGKYHVGMNWRFETKDGVGYRVDEDFFVPGFFPDCPFGTVIHRPQKK